MRYALISLLLIALQQSTIQAVRLPEHDSDDITGQIHQHLAQGAVKRANANEWLLKKQGDLRGYEILIIIAAASLLLLFLFDLVLIVVAAWLFRKYRKSTPRKIGKRIQDIVSKVEEIRTRAASVSPDKMKEIPMLIKEVLEDLKDLSHLR